MKRCILIASLWTFAAVFIFESVRWWANGTWNHWLAPVLIYTPIFFAALADNWPEETNGPR